MTIERILGTDTGKAAFEKADRNAVALEIQMNSFIDKGYVNSKTISDFNNATENGKYIGYNALNAPSNGTVLLDVIREGASPPIAQFATVVYGTSEGTSYYRIKRADNTWIAWKQLVTTEKTEMDIPLASGFTADTATVGWKHKIVRNGDGSYDLWFAVKKTDNSNIPTGYIQIGSMVAGHIPNAFYIGNGLSVENDTSFAVGFCYVDNSRLMFHNIFASAKSLRGYIRFRTN